MRILAIALAVLFGAHSELCALDANCTTTTNLGMARCPEESTDWYESYTDQIDELDALAKTAKSSFTVAGSSFSVGGSTFVVTAGKIGFGTGTMGAYKVHLQDTGGINDYMAFSSGTAASQLTGKITYSGTPSMVVRAGSAKYLELQGGDGTAGIKVSHRGLMIPYLRTLAQIQAFTPITGELGGQFTCSDCAVAYSVCTATGTTVQGFKLGVSGALAECK